MISYYLNICFQIKTAYLIEGNEIWSEISTWREGYGQSLLQYELHHFCSVSCYNNLTVKLPC